MSSEIMVMKNDKIVGYDVDAFQAMVETWAPRMQSGSELFTPLLDSKARMELSFEGRDDRGKGRFFILPSVGGAFVSIFPSSQILDTVGPGIATAAFGACATGFTLLGYASFRVFKYVTREKADTAKFLVKENHQYNTEFLKEWLRSRYSLSSVPEDDLRNMVVHLYWETPVQFVDTNNVGRLWNFAYDTVKAGWFVEEVKSATEKEATVTPAALVQGVATQELAEAKLLVDTDLLPNECVVLLESFKAKQRVLEDLSLSTESQHALLRSQQDLRQGLNLFSKLSSAGKVEVAATLLAENLTLLNNELSILLQQVTDVLANDFRSQNAYLKSRQLVSDSALVLPASVIVDEVAPVSVDGTEYENDRVR